MDVEKYTNSKLYFIFEWGFKLIIWNLLSLLIICLVAGAPFLIFFSIQDNNSIENVEVINEASEEIIEITQKKGDKTEIGNRKIYGEITNIASNEIEIVFYINEIQIQINNVNRLRNIDNMYFDNDDLIIVNNNTEYNYGNIYDSQIDMKSSHIDGYQNVVIAYENGAFVNYGIKVDTQATISGILVIVGFLLGLLAFIPCFITIFSMIKIFSEDGSADTFILYFNRLWDNFKSIYKLELFLIPIIVLLSYGMYSYYYIINSLSEPNFFFSISYNLILVCLIGIVLFILNLPMSLGYFRMTSKTIFRFTLRMTFRNILYSLLYVVIMAVPLLLCLVNNFFIPIWFLIGLSLPLVLMYLVSSKKYHNLVLNFNNNLFEDNDDDSDN